MKRMLYTARQTAYTLFSFCYFLGTAFVFTVAGFIILTVGGRTEKHKRLYHRLLQRNARFVVNHIPGTDFCYINKPKETFEKPSVIISNHQSHLDLMAIMMLAPNLIILTKSWVWHNPFYGLIIRYADYLPVGDTETMMSMIRDRIAHGYSLVVFPEGTRSADCHIQRFHRGAFKMAEELGLDIIPVFIHGFGEVLPKTSAQLHPGKLTLEVWPRITRDNDDRKTGGYRKVARTVRQMYVDRNEEMRNHR